MSRTENELVAAIERSPDTAVPYLAYGEWLAAQGDVRGKLIALHHANELSEASAWIEANLDQLWGSAAGALAALTPHAGARGNSTRWRWGFLESLWLSDQVDYEQRVYGDPRRATFDTIDVLDQLLAHPSTRFLRELTIGTLAHDDTYARAARVIARHPRATLRTLMLGDINTEDEGLVGTIGDLAPLATLPALESLTLLGGSLAPGASRPPRLNELCVITDLATHDSLPAICAASWPAVETLRLEIGVNTVAAAALVPVLSGVAFPRLAHLQLRFTASPELASAIATSVVARQLEVLDLSGVALDDHDALALAAGQFPRLRRLDLSDNMLSSRGVAAIQGLCAEVQIGRQAP